MSGASGFLLMLVGAAMAARSLVRDTRDPPKKWSRPRFDGLFWGTMVALFGLVWVLAAL